jgi:hypothetical protein
MTPAELNMLIHNLNDRELTDYKKRISISFYVGYFVTKGQSKDGLCSEDLSEVLEKIDNPESILEDGAMMAKADIILESYTKRGLKNG